MKELTKAEEEIMQLLWKQEEANVATLIEQIPEPKPAYNTVSTIVRILENKGFVTYKKQGRGHIYYPLIAKEHYQKFSLSKLMDNYFEGSPKRLMSFFVRKNEVSLQDLEEILAEINKNSKK